MAHLPVMLARCGGNKFTMVLLETSGVRLGRGRNAYGKGSMLDQFKQTISEESFSRSKSRSASVAKYRGNADSGNAPIEAANQALYRVMRQDCNRVAHFHVG